MVSESGKPSHASTSAPSDVGRKAEEHLGHPVRRDRTVELPLGRIEVWRSERRRPSKMAPYYVSPGGELIRTDASWSSFQNMLRASRPDLADQDLLARLVACGPGRRLLVTEEYEVPEPYRNGPWAPERTALGGWTAHCIDTIEGRWERLEIESDYTVRVEVLGPAPKTNIR